MAIHQASNAPISRKGNIRYADMFKIVTGTPSEDFKKNYDAIDWSTIKTTATDENGVVHAKA